MTNTDKHQKRRTIRVGDPLWDAFVEKCKEDDIPAAIRVRQLIRQDVNAKKGKK